LAHVHDAGVTAARHVYVLFLFFPFAVKSPIVSLRGATIDEPSEPGMHKKPR
jgi:hypothetical protein